MDERQERKLAGQRRWRDANKERISEYGKQYYRDNREQCLERSKRSHRANPELRRHIALRNKYGITLEDYNIMFEAQGGCCAICKRHQFELKKRLVVDHSHDTGGVRALLCDDCNHGIGFFKDSQSLLNQAIEYLNVHNPRTD